MHKQGKGVDSSEVSDKSVERIEGEKEKQEYVWEMCVLVCLCV